MKRKLWLFIYFILNGCFFLVAQYPKYQFKHLSTLDGLSQSSVIAIEQDNLGQMWLGTRDGLNVYNGHSFKVFRNDPYDSTSISNSDILDITQDSEGYIWIGTYNGLNRYDPVSGIFKSFFYSSDENSLSNNTVWCVTEMQNGEIWAGTSKGLSIYNKKINNFKKVYAAINSTSALPSNYILSISQSDDGTIWIGTAEGFCKVVSTTNGQYKFQSFTPENEKVPLFVQSILPYGKNSICIGTKTKGMYWFDTLNEKFINNSIDTDVRVIKKTQDGNLWIGTSDGVTYLDEKGNYEKLVNVPYDSRSLSHNYIKSIFLDKKGSVWIGSYYGGIDIWDVSNNNFINYGEHFTQNRLSFKVVSSIVADTDKNLYFGTEGGGITIFDPEKYETTYINKENSPELLSDNIKALLLVDDNLWIGSYDKGIKVYNTKRKTFDTTFLPKELYQLINDTGVFTIKSGGRNSIWIGTFGNGLIRYNTATKTSQLFRSTLNPENSLSNNRIRSMMTDNKLNVWAGTQSGLNLLSFSENGTLKSIEHYFYNQETTSGDDILAIYQDSNGTIWVGVRAKGLYKFNGEKFDKVPVETGKTVTSVYSILEDAEKNLWMSSNQGLIKYEPNSGFFTIYDQKDGLAGNEFNSGASLKVGNSTFYFGGPTGVTTFDSKKIDKNTFAPQVLLSDFKIQNKTISPNNSPEILSKNISFVNAITLEHDKANFSINYAIPNFINSSNNKYKYRMVGLENSWTETTQNQANYTIQRPGDYIFEVMGANNDGIWNTTPTILKITVKPDIWKSNLAYILYSLLLLSGIIALGNIIRSQTKLKHKLQLEHLEKVRNQEINDEKLKFFTNISHEFRTPLTLISGPLQKLLEDYKGSSFVYKKLLVIESNANHLLQLINRLMDFRKLENNKFKLEAAEGNIVKFLREIYHSFSEYAKSRNDSYTFESDEDEILLFYDRPKLEQVFFNLISNAFKYTPQNGQIKIIIKKIDSHIVIDIMDSGPGIDEKYSEKVFDRFFEIPEYQKNINGQGTGTGIGLSIAKGFVDLHKGEISVLNNVLQGSVFRVKLPLGKDHLEKDQIIKDFKFSDDLGLYTSQVNHINFEANFEADELLFDTEKATVLLVEDNEPLRKFMKELLKENYNILEAANGEEAMKIALQNVPDLIVSDVIMPVMVGTELCSKIKANLKTSHIPVILLTSRTSLVYKFEGLESGADDYISKPFNIKEFSLRVKNLIDSTRRLRNKFSTENTFTPSDITVSSMDEQLLKKALQIVEDNISNEQFDIPTFSSELGVSRTLLFTKIKAWTNVTPNDFIQEIRMKRAVQLLEQDKLNISEVSYQVGFKNPKYFSKCFHKKFGKSPTEYLAKFSETHHK